MALEITDQNFQEQVLDAETVVLVDFWAPWCGPCRTIAPIIDELHQEFDRKAVIGKINVDDNSETCSKYGIMSIPALLFFKDGEVVDKLVGGVPKSQIVEKLNNQI